ncbi:unnamed protein product [Amoebophrya sp. A120]|nr:unnamed protein product [Amoebophrya sp. A120]|eukprot:GSA120T00013892001.1
MPAVPRQHDKLDLDGAEICHAPLRNWASNWDRLYALRVISTLSISILTPPYHGFVLYTETDTESHDEIIDEIPLIEVQFSDRTLLRIANYNDWHRGRKHGKDQGLRRSMDLERYIRDGGKRYVKEYFQTGTNTDGSASPNKYPLSPLVSGHKMAAASTSSSTSLAIYDPKKAGSNQLVIKNDPASTKNHRLYECVSSFSVPGQPKFVLIDNPWKFAVALGNVDLLQKLLSTYPQYSPEACLDGSRIYDLLFSQDPTRYGQMAVQFSRQSATRMLEFLLAHPLSNPHWWLHMLLVCFHESQQGSYTYNLMTGKTAARELPMDYVNLILAAVGLSTKHRSVRSDNHAFSNDDPRPLDMDVFWKPLFLVLNHDDVDVNHVSPSTGKTALHLACLSGNVEAVELLLKHPLLKLDIKAGHNDGRTALDIALDQEMRKDLNPEEMQRRILLTDILLLDSRMMPTMTKKSGRGVSGGGSGGNVSGGRSSGGASSSKASPSSSPKLNATAYMRAIPGSPTDMYHKKKC